MILDDAIECPRCRRKTKLVDELRFNDKPVLTLCSTCSEKLVTLDEDGKRVLLLERLFAEFRQLVDGIANAVDKPCPLCAGHGWRSLGGGRGLRLQRCPDCVGTGVSVQSILQVLEVDEKPRPVKHDDSTGFSPGQAPAKIKTR